MMKASKAVSERIKRRTKVNKFSKLEFNDFSELEFNNFSELELIKAG